MAVVSAFTIIRCISLFHVTLAFFFLTSPRTIADQNVVFLLGESMKLVNPGNSNGMLDRLLISKKPTPSVFNKPSAATAFIALILAFLGITDLTAVSMPEEYAEIYWGTQTPVRLLFLFIITGYTYMFKEGGILTATGGNYKLSAGDNLKNSVVFTWSFLELSAWFWVQAHRINFFIMS